MGSTEAKTGRERIAQMQADEARRGKRNRIYALTAGLLAVVLLAVGVFWMSSQNSSSSKVSEKEQLADTSYIKAMQTIPASTFDKVGAGKSMAQFTSLAQNKPETENGKPRLLYVGAEYCPYCAMERWSLVAALSRFGTFTGLQPQLSSPTEQQLANIPTVTFLKASYSSKYLAFKSYEKEDRSGNALQTLSAADSALFEANSQGIPWLDWAGTAQSSTALNEPSMAGKRGTDISKQLENPSSEYAQAIVGAANVQSAKICQLTKNQPASVCDSAGVKAAASKL